MVPTMGFQIEKGNCLGDHKSSRRKSLKVEFLGTRGKIKWVEEKVDKFSPAEEPQRAITYLWQAYHICRATMTVLET